MITKKHFLFFFFTKYSDTHLESTLEKSNGVLLSPTGQTFTFEQRDTRLPPDLLPYGPQTIPIQISSSIPAENDQYTILSSSYDKPMPYTENLASSNSSLKDLHIYQDCGSSYGLAQKSAAQTQITNGNSNSTSSNNSSSYRNLRSSMDVPCKPRQSIVRTSPSFSFLSTGYQQQNNFL